MWSASVLAASVAPIEHEHAWADINNAPAFITADALNGYATETYVGNQISALNLGTASQKDYTKSVAQNGTDLPTSGAVYSAIAAAVTSALHYRGISSVELTDGGTQTAVIGGVSLVAQAGDVVIYNGLEFLWEKNSSNTYVWNKLGDDSSYALKTVQIIAGTGLTGGGNLSSNVTISLSQATITSLGKADTALQSSALDGYVNEIATGTGNYISGVSKSGKKLTFTYGTLPTTIAWTNVTGRPTALSDLTNDIISDWALATSKPTYALSEITGTDDLRAIEAITGTSGLLKKTAANTWSLDTNTYLTSSSHKALTLKVGTTTIGSDYTSLAAKTYTISKQNLTDTIGSTTYAAYNASGYLPLSGGTLTGALTGTSATFTSGSITDLAVSSKLAIPTSAPSGPDSGKIYLYASSLGEYAVEPWYGFNQLVENGDFASTSGWSMPYSGPTITVANNILTLTCGTSNNYRPQVYHLISVAANHKIYYTYTIKITTSSPASQRNAFLYSSSGSQYIPTTYSSDSEFADWKKVSAIITTTRAYTRIYIGRMAGSSAPLNQGDTVQIKNVMIIDLTEMFGDNIPTVEQFEAMYPQEYYDYTPIGG